MDEVEVDLRVLVFVTHSKRENVKEVTVAAFRMEVIYFHLLTKQNKQS